MRRNLIAVTMTIAMAFPVAAQQASLSGTWKLNLTSSFLATDHPAHDYQLTKVLLQDGPAMHQTDIATHVSVVNIPMPDTRITMEFSTDGRESYAEVPGSFSGMPPVRLRVTAEWQGNTLLVTERNTSSGGASTTERRYFLNNGGARLIELVEVHGVVHDSEQRLVFDRLSGSTASDSKLR